MARARNNVREIVGTRVALFAQPAFLESYRDPVSVTLGPAAGTVRTGPADDRMYTVMPIGKHQPYGPSDDGGLSIPPWLGPQDTPAVPDADGHFDYLRPGDPGFMSAHAYGAARLTLDMLERYCGPIPWHFSAEYARLEILSIDNYDNASCGWGYLELGVNQQQRGRSYPFALNFDIIAHEMGHLAVFSMSGMPDPFSPAGEQRAFHEAMADLVALLAATQLQPVVDQVLQTTQGNLYINNELNRIGELSPSDQIRMASNSVSLFEFESGWADEHDLALPLVGAFFDILVEIYQRLLVDAGLLDPRILDLAENLERMQAFEHPVQDQHEAAFEAQPAAFYEAFYVARDHLGHLLAGVWKNVDARTLTYADVAVAAIMTERRLTGGRFEDTLRRSFEWRGIGVVSVGPMLPDLPARSHVSSSRTFVPGIDYRAGGRRAHRSGRARRRRIA